MKQRKGNRALIFLVSICLVLLVGMGVFTSCSSETPTPATSSAPPTTVAPEPIVLIFTDWDPETNTMVTGVYKPWFALLEQRTGGRVKVEAHFSGELVSLPDAYNAVIKGTVDIAHILPQTVPSFVMDSVFHLVPYDSLGWRPSRTYLDLYNKYPELQAQYSQVKPLLLHPMFASHIGTTKKAVNVLEDNKGLKMITGGPIAAARAQSLGSVPVSSTPPETYSFWEKGVADGGNVVTLPELFTNKWGDVIKYINLIPMTRPPMATIMNLQKFNSLPPDIQKIINDMIPEITDLFDKNQVLTYKDALARAPKELGTTFVTPSKDEIARWMAVDKAVVDKFIADLEAKGLPGKQFYADYLALEKKYSAAEYEFK